MNQQLFGIVLKETTTRCLIALEHAGALDLKTIRSTYDDPKGRYGKIVKYWIDYTIDYANLSLPFNDIALPYMTDAFNRVLNGLEDDRGLSKRNLCREYNGSGSRFYDIVINTMKTCIPLYDIYTEQFKKTGSIDHVGPLTTLDARNK